MKTILTLTAFGILGIGRLSAQWNNVAPDASDFSKIKFTSSNVAYLNKGTSSGPVMHLSKTTDGGGTWSIVPFNPILNVRDFSFINDNIGFLSADTIGSGIPYTLSVYGTTNGGATWNHLHLFPSGIPVGSRIHFNDALHGIITETYGRIWSTADGGINWTEHLIGYAYPQDIDFPSPNIGYVTCADGTFAYYGLVFKTTDGGATWNEVFNFEDLPLNYSTAGAVDFIDENTGYMETMNNFYKTTDGGVTWDSLPFAHDNGMYFQDIVFTSANTGFGCDNLGGIFKTTDGGTTWTTDLPADSVTWFYSLSQGPGSVYAAGTGGKLLRNGTVGIKEKINAENLNIYPNPSGTGRFYFDKKDAKPVDVRVYNAQGELVLTLDQFIANQLDLSCKDNGIYLVQAGNADEGTLSTGRVVVSK